MKFFSICLLVLLFPVLAFGAPVLTCDPQSGVTKYRVRLDPAAAWTEGDATTEGAAWFPLDQWPQGRYPDCEMQAGGEVAITDSTTGNRTTAMQWSESAPFVFEKMTSNTPENLGVVDAPF